MKNVFLYIAVTVALLTGACNPADELLPPRAGNAVYYWRTIFMLDSTEQAFLHHNDIKYVYCRYFDVVLDESGQTRPNATIQFAQHLSDSIEIIPTVFIMNDCMQKSALTSEGKENTGDFARKIVERILQMNETHDIKNVHEIQIDCDYTATNRELYYRFLKEVGRTAAKRGLRLSTTIRLHQLAMPAPPADYGILMLYNTGDPGRALEPTPNDRRQEIRNPILDLRDVKPYLHFLKDYNLPMGAAYPTFVWNRNIHGVTIAHTADYEEIARTKRLVEAERRDMRQLILTYHLDNNNINRYTPKQYEEIYHH